LSLKILITGGLGLVGGRLACHFIKLGHNVEISSRNPSKYSGVLKKAKIKKIEYDDQLSLENHLISVDVIIHAAGMNAKECIDDQRAAIKFNGEATSKLVAAAIRAKVSRFIFLSTAHVYSSPLQGLINENTSTINKHPYATSNLLGEKAVLNQCRLQKTQGIILRLTNAFGVPIHKNVNCWMLLINDLCRQAVQYRRIILNSNGFEERDFIALSNVCLGLEYFVLTKKIGDQYEIFNLASGFSHSVLEIANLIQFRCFQVLGFRPELKLSRKGSSQNKVKLKFNTNRIQKIGIDLNLREITEEIDNLLLYCYSTFEKT
tara:strand:+ start:1108 stop:2064 length:957 start_codon:yes stop_codon:yes gene_type:complete